MGYYKKELGRRDFFKKAFVAGAATVATPHILFSESKHNPVDSLQGGPAHEEYLETIVEKTINFNEWDAILVYDKSIIAKAHGIDVELGIDRPVIDVTSCDSPLDEDGYQMKEFLPGPMSWKVTMRNIFSDTPLDILHKVLDKSPLLSIYIRDEGRNAKYQGDCMIEKFTTTVERSFPMSSNIHVYGSGALTKIPKEQ